jgi:hypothetical protein
MLSNHRTAAVQVVIVWSFVVSAVIGYSGGCDGDGGVSLTEGDRQTLTSSGHFVENCHFARQGRWSKCYKTAVLMTGVGHRASHNLINGHPHYVILYSGNEHLVEFNEIHRIALETSV